MFRFATIEELRSSASRFLALLLVLHLPVVLGIGLLGHVPVAVPFAIAAIAVASAALLAFRAPLALATRLVITVATVLMPMIFVHLAMGPLQIDWHMYFFPVLVMIALWIDWRPLVLGVALIAVHHLVMSFVMPMSVFPDQSGIAALPRVLLHASIVIAQAGVLLWLMEAIRRLYARVRHESSVANEALTEAERLRATLEGEAREREAAARDLELALTSSVAASEQAALAEERRHEVEQSVARSQIDFVRRTAERMDESVGALVEKFAAATDNLLASARSAQEAAAAADSDSRLISAEAHESSVMVNSVATAALELSTTSADILSRMQTALVVGEKASNHTSSGSQFARSLENGSGRIDDVTAIIENIASQTNLLALNAAIEAARAGDAGRGFAVVADEVRKLADETTTATREIAQVVASMRDNTKNVIDVMKLIESSVAEMLSMATDVAAAVEEQTAATRQIADATTQVRSATLQTASASERLTAVAELSGEASRQVFSESQSVAATTTTLRQSVEKMVGDIMRHASAQTPV